MPGSHGYQAVHWDAVGGYTSDGLLLHRVRAERALGKPLPSRAEVHHADGSKSDDGPLVICQDRAYHLLLHARMRVLKAGGNPNTDALCGSCGQVKNRAEFLTRTDRRNGNIVLRDGCRDCRNARRRHYPQYR
jgi:hypothetical protein